MTYMEFIKKCKPDVEKDLIQEHHIIPKSIWNSRENRTTVKLSPAQHMWAHILYDKENGTNTRKAFIRFYSCKKEPSSYKQCLFANEIHREYQEIRHKPTGKFHPCTDPEKIKIRNQRISETMKKDYASGKRISYMKGIHFSDTYKQNMSKICTEVKQTQAAKYWEYRKNGGQLKWNAYCKAICNNEPIE